jgi:cold-inducible RNA-binding protein
MVTFASMKLFVKNIEPSVNEVLLESIFSQFGKVKETKIVYDKITWESRGFGFVEFEKKEDAEKAMAELNGKELVGKNLSVEEAVEKRR